MTQRPCKPRQQLYKGKPHTMLVCPDCQQAMPGIPYPYGIGLLTLPVHYDPRRTKKRFLTIRAGKSVTARSVTAQSRSVGTTDPTTDPNTKASSPTSSPASVTAMRRKEVTPT